MRARAEREHQRQLVEAARPDDVGVRAHRRVDRVHAAVDQRIGPVAADVRDLDRLEVRRRRRRRAGDLRQREVIGRVAAGARRAEEEREPVLDVVGRDEHVGQRGRQPRVAEILPRSRCRARRRRSARRSSRRARRSSSAGCGEDLRALLDVDVGQLFGAVERPPVGRRRAPGRRRGSRPVEVPAMRSTISAIRRPVRRSISASTSAGIRPRMPPPSMQSTFMPLFGAGEISSSASSIAPKRDGSRGGALDDVVGAAPLAVGQQAPARDPEVDRPRDGGRSAPASTARARPRSRRTAAARSAPWRRAGGRPSRARTARGSPGSPTSSAGPASAGMPRSPRDAPVQPLGHPLGGLHAEAVGEELLGELAVALELRHQLGHLVAGRDGLERDDVELAARSFGRKKSARQMRSPVGWRGNDQALEHRRRGPRGRARRSRCPRSSRGSSRAARAGAGSPARATCAPAAGGSRPSTSRRQASPFTPRPPQCSLKRTCVSRWG